MKTAHGSATDGANTALRIECLRSASALQEHRQAMEDLARTALEANPFYEPWLLLPAMEAFDSGDLHVVLAWLPDGRLAGLFPLQLHKGGARTGPARLQMWKHLYCFLCTPLVAETHARAALAALLDWLASGSSPARCLDLQGVGAGGPFETVLEDLLGGRREWARQKTHYTRALLDVGPEAVVPTYPAKRLKELRRLERRLAQQGAVRHAVLGPDADVETWVQRFLELEASGWKGREGTALACDPASSAFFVEVTRQAHRRGQLHMLALELDGVAIAMQCNFLSGAGAYAFKVAFDEQHAAVSPGVQLELFAMRHFAGDCPDLAWVDSCASPDHALMNRLWPDRRPLADHVIAMRMSPAHLRVLYLRLRKRLKQLLRR